MAHSAELSARVTFLFLYPELAGRQADESWNQLYEIIVKGFKNPDTL
jgi:hypothetical protein